MTKFSVLSFCWLLFTLFPPAEVLSQETDDPVIATVGDSKVYQSQVQQEFQRKFADREVSDALKAGLHSQILQRLIQQQLVLAKFAGSDVLATDDEVNLEIARLRERLQQTERTLEQFLAANHQSMAGLRFDLRWQISWKRYLDRTLTDEVLERYFERQRRRFDGTRIRVAHILWKLSSDEGGDVVASRQTALQNEAERVRRQINEGTLTWADFSDRF